MYGKYRKSGDCTVNEYCTLNLPQPVHGVGTVTVLTVQRQKLRHSEADKHQRNIVKPKHATFTTLPLR